MKFIRACLLLMLLLFNAACASNLGKHDSDISKEEWCDRDETIPWTGCWRELQRIDCETGEEFESDESIGELRLRSDGRFSVTWHPFESYTDFAGSYVTNEIEGSITFDHIDSSGYDGEGLYYMRENGDLELIDIWFGFFYADSDSAPETIACGYVFRNK